ncbi:MAG TPA: bifunctional phosphoribosylaminoimidazolecarboxamide formyltransferase/IMP cyclohydrolase [Pirellulales bacterium]|jgi:phosphoribosylaminoimidazolecarboxamide formyltransferase/IMP cyclohydrolase|nr:bifunctional phosphoribosylaminoimidazolecarboxamide formyltransferase/IMP cyclohydrolase [Pirellulales bacterium]
MVESAVIQRALISVSDKSGLAELAARLVAAKVSILSTGGTRKFLESHGIPVEDVADYTQMPEMMDGRVKTLHPRIHGGILFRRDRAEDRQALEQHGIKPIDLVVVNLYPFAATIARPGVSDAEAIEQIDIGGPSLVRAAAKNHAFVTVATAPDQYAAIAEQLAENRSTTYELRRQLAGAAFAHTAGYDAAIAEYFARSENSEAFPSQLQLALERLELLRYGENPHQQAALYGEPHPPADSLVSARKLHGKELSYNNLLDLDSALAIVKALAGPAVAVIKHNNPCGAATAQQLADAARRALDGDPLSAFGSVLAFNRAVDAATAELLSEPGRFVEAIVAPGFDPAAFEILTTRPKWKANVRLLEVGELQPPALRRDYRTVSGGLLVQTADNLPDDESEWKVVTEKPPSESQWRDLRFAWLLARFVKSNAIVLAQSQALCGVGAGQMSRVDSVQIAIQKAGERARGSALGSDAFFPFADGVQAAAGAGVAAIIQPGGSRNDDEVIRACNELGVTMVFTGRRHFKH